MTGDPSDHPMTPEVWEMLTAIQAPQSCRYADTAGYCPCHRPTMGQVIDGARPAPHCPSCRCEEIARTQEAERGFHVWSSNPLTKRSREPFDWNYPGALPVELL